VINAGHNGDSVVALLARVDEVLSCEPDAVAVHPGGFDAFRRCPLVDFKASLLQLVDRLQEAKARVGLISLHVNGDDLASDFNRRATLFNDVIAGVAAACSADYLPLRERMIAELEAEPGARAWSGQAWMAPAAAAQRYLLGRSFDEISRRHGFRFNVDGIHLNSRGAALLAGVITEFLEAARAGGTRR
jgi:acyl-CoA thioesterase-1